MSRTQILNLSHLYSFTKPHVQNIVTDNQIVLVRSTFIRHHYMFRTHPDINTARMTFNHQLSIGWQVCTPPHFNLQYTQHELIFIVRSLVFGL
jgi:hypothetical protein